MRRLEHAKALPLSLALAFSLLLSCLDGAAKKTEGEASKNTTPRYKLVVLGDSLTEGYGIAKAEAWPKIVENNLLKAQLDVQVVNAGISGSTSASAKSRIKWYLKSHPTHLILALGGNDGLRGLPTESLYNNLDQTIQLAKKNGVTVILAGMKTPKNYGEDYSKRFTEVYRKLSKKWKITLIPFLLKGVGGVTNLNLSDGIHPNERGHQVIAKTVTQKLLEVL